MNKQEAYIILGALEGEEETAIQKIIFDTKNYIFQNSVVSKVYQSKIKRLSVLSEAENVIKKIEIKSPEAINLPVWSNIISDSIVYLRAYEQKMSQLKLQINQSNSITQLQLVMQSILDLEENRLDDWFVQAKEIGVEATDTEGIKISEVMSTGKILSELKMAKENGNSHIDLTLVNQTEFLKKELYRVFKCKFA